MFKFEKLRCVPFSSNLYPPYLASIIGVLAVHGEDSEALFVGGDGALRHKQGLTRLLALVVGTRRAIWTRRLWLHLVKIWLVSLDHVMMQEMVVCC